MEQNIFQLTEKIMQVVPDYNDILNITCVVKKNDTDTYSGVVESNKGYHKLMPHVAEAIYDFTKKYILNHEHIKDNQLLQFRTGLLANGSMRINLGMFDDEISRINNKKNNTLNMRDASIHWISNDAVQELVLHSITSSIIHINNNI